jgi:group I intron endonuclease
MEQKPCQVYYCYKTTNIINGKVYIGFASDPKTRWRNHRRDAETGRGFALAAAIRKYGWDAFEFEVLCCGKDKRMMLEHVEPALIEQYQSRIEQNGYNVTRGGEHIPVGNRGGSKKGRIVSEESRCKMSAAKKGNVNGAGNKGHKHSDETKQKMAAVHLGHFVSEETRKKIGNRYPRTEEEKQHLSKINTGRKHSEETKQKMAATRRAMRIL